MEGFTPTDDDVGRGEKSLIAKKIVKILQEKGRFLEKDGDGWWVQAAEEIALEKILSSFRTSRFRKKAESRSFKSQKELGQQLVKRPKTDLAGGISTALVSASSTESVGVGCFTNCCSSKGDSPSNIVSRQVQPYL